MEFSVFLVFAVWTSSLTYFTFSKERERAMVFPDYYFFAERRLVNHTIDEKRVKNLDDCELFCYLNDDCVSLNYKKDPENDKTGYNCQLNNATHLKYDSDLTTDAKFYYRGSKNACDKSPQCQNNATCQSGFTFKGYRCLCPSGYKGEHCEKDKCEASIGKCHEEATCNNTNGSYVCICKPGFIGDGHNCTDVDECQRNHSCHENANCTNTIGSHVCNCQPGYTGDGQNCTDIDECETKPHKCHEEAACNNIHGSYLCTCKPGFIGDGQNCTDVDECKVKNSCHENANCTNTFGSHVCYCQPGYTGNGQNCTDIDECGTSSGRCHEKAACNNTPGSYVCTCEPGFIGDGQNCTDVDECKGNHSCHENANCTNTIGSHECYCQLGYTGNGQNCTDIDECSEAHPLKMNECHPNASCINNQGSYNCSCNPTFIGNGFECIADPCYHYSNLSEASRNTNIETQPGEALCDNGLPKGWHRFVGDAGTRMPTERVPAFRCGTHWSGWLMTAHPSVEDGKVLGKVCFSARSPGSKCVDERSIFVINCGLYYLYELFAPNACSRRFCGTDEK